MTAGLRLALEQRARGFRLFPRRLGAVAAKLGTELGLADGTSVSLVTCSVPAIRKLAGVHFGRAHATDVIAFPTGFTEFPGLLGEVWIAPDTVARNGREFGKGLNGEFLFVLAHGLLHLLGERDDTASRRNAMFARQETLLEASRDEAGKLPRVIRRVAPAT